MGVGASEGDGHESFYNHPLPEEEFESREGVFKAVYLGGVGIFVL